MTNAVIVERDDQVEGLRGTDSPEVVLLGRVPDGVPPLHVSFAGDVVELGSTTLSGQTCKGRFTLALDSAVKVSGTTVIRPNQGAL